MKTIQCKHSDAEGKWEICEHLLSRIGEEYNPSARGHYRRYTGSGAQYILLCNGCAKASEPVEQHLRWVCHACYDDVAQWGKRLGVQGSPEARERISGAKLVHTEVSCPEALGRLATVAPVCGSTNCQWLALNDRNELVLVDAEAGSHRRLLRLDALEVALDQPKTLIASPTGEFAVIASTFGSHGVVVNTRTSKPIMHLDRGTYRVEHCRFPAAFFEHEGRVLLVHATDWNRLDISDPLTGEVITRRHPTSYEREEKRPPHYLDYFQCGLCVSPDGEWIAGNGWVWHPVGAVDTWSLRQWVNKNVWEAEDGATKKRLCWRDYYWDGPLCWVGKRTLAIWGHGDDDLLLVPGIRLFDVETGNELPGFPGPVVVGSRLEEVTSNGQMHQIPHATGTLVFDEFLFSFDAGCEFAVWDVGTGERLLHEESFLPLGYHPTSKLFLSQTQDGSIRLTKFVMG